MIDHYLPSSDRYESGMIYNRCGRSGVLIPQISLGMWQNFGSTAPYERSKAILRTAFDEGICHFDLANNYGPVFGSAEENFGKMMQTDFKPFRDEMFISTKAGWSMWPGPYGDWGSRKYLMASLDQSLKRMHLDYVDIFYSHRYDPNTPLEETLQALVDIVRSGKALYVGISSYPYEAAKFAYEYLEAHDTHCLLNQTKLNMLYTDPIEEHILELGQEKGVGFIAFSPLAQGQLTNRYLNGVPAGSRGDNGTLKGSVTPELVEKLNKLNDMAAERGQSLAQMALSWDFAQPGLTSVIVGASSVEQLKDSLKAVHSPALTSEELTRIADILK